MKFEDLGNDAFLNELKEGAELNSLLKLLYKRGVENILEGEFDAHLSLHKYNWVKRKNAQNGYSKIILKSLFGEVEIVIPRDRDGIFSPKLVKKDQSTFYEEGYIEHIIISFYVKGMCTVDIEDKIREIYNLDISKSTVSSISNKIIADIVAWNNTPLETTYLIVWMDSIDFYVLENSKRINKTMHVAVGLHIDGKKEVLGLWLEKEGSSSFWINVLTDIKARGIQDILITATDNLYCFDDAIKVMFPESVSLTNIINQTKNE